MKVLFIGGTGVISHACTQHIVRHTDWELYLLNRGSKSLPDGVRGLTGNVDDTEGMKALLEGRRFDAVVNFVAFTPDDVARDIALFRGRVGQYVFFGTASSYQKPPTAAVIDESTPLENPFWEYSRLKTRGERLLADEREASGFPCTIVRPSHTYDGDKVPLAVASPKSGWPVIQRMREGRPVIIHGDGTSLWAITHSRDFALGLAGLLGNPHAIGHAVQIVGDELLTWNAIYEALAAAVGVKLNAVHVDSEFLAASNPYFQGTLLGDKSYSTVFDNSKIKRLVPDFRTRIRFDQGIREVVKKYLDTPALQVEDPAFDHWCDRVIHHRNQAIEALVAENLGFPGGIPSRAPFRKG